MRAIYLTVFAVLVAASAFSATAPPSAGVWNIATTGKAASSGDLAFRVTATNGSDPVEITVPVIAGASEDSIARAIRRALSSQLPRDRFNVQLGESGNVLVSDSRGRPDFTLELLDSDIENVRVAVQSVTPSAGPTVPEQAEPAIPPPAIASPPAGASSAPIPVPDPVRPPGPSPTLPSPSPAAPSPAPVPAPSPAAPPTTPAPMSPAPTSPAPVSPPPNSTGGAGASATAPPATTPPPR